MNQTKELINRHRFAVGYTVGWVMTLLAVLLGASL
jgi:hypothetical protein